MLLTNCKAFIDNDFIDCDISVTDNRISGIFEPGCAPSDEETYSLGGKFVIPGMIDLNVSGADGYDFSDADASAFQHISDAVLRCGVTGYLATVNAFPKSVLEETYEFLGSRLNRKSDSAKLLGIHMRGPFISKNCPGYQDASCFKRTNAMFFHDMNETGRNGVRLVTVSPELENAPAFIREVSKYSRVALADSESSFDTAREAFEAGATAAVDLFLNTKPGSFADPGLTGAALNLADYLLLHYDGSEDIHPAMIEQAFRLAGDKLCLTSNSSAFLGLERGTYEIEGHEIKLRDSGATFEDGRKAGSISDLLECVVQTLDKTNVSLQAVIRSVTENPARMLGIFDQVGSIAEGKQADLVILDSHNLQIHGVILGGKPFGTL